VEGHPPFERNAPLATLTAVVVDEPEEAVHAGPLWPVISGLLRKDPGERLDVAQAEQLLREVAGHDEAATAPGPAAPAAPVAVARRPRWPRGPVIGLAALVLVAAAVTALALALTSSPGHPAASRPSGSPAGSPNGGSAGYGPLPAGYYRFTNSTGFSIGVPNDWQISHVGHYVYVTDPSNSGIFLLIDQSDTPNPNPLANWEQQAANRASTYPDYHLIRLESVSYPQAEKAADWEFTYVRDGIPVHILNRNVLANAQHAYALYWSTPESDWNADYHYFQAFADTFRPEN
jgi:hypothetical protein